MTASEFLTYDTMIAMTKSGGKWKEGMPLDFYGRLTTVANHNGRGAEQEGDNMRAMARKEWLVPLPKLGSHGTRRYRIVEHAEFITEHPGSCPPYRYEPESGDYVGDGVMPIAFAEEQIRQHPDKPGWVGMWHQGEETANGLPPAGNRVATVEFEPVSSRENSRPEKEQPKR